MYVCMYIHTSIAQSSPTVSTYQAGGPPPMHHAPCLGHCTIPPGHILKFSAGRHTDIKMDIKVGDGEVPKPSTF